MSNKGAFSVVRDALHDLIGSFIVDSPHLEPQAAKYGAFDARANLVEFSTGSSYRTLRLRTVVVASESRHRPPHKHSAEALLWRI